MELIIHGHPTLASALVVEQGKLAALLLIEPKDHTIDKETFLKEIWPQLGRAKIEANGGS